jgi:hypothetical protein
VLGLSHNILLIYVNHVPFRHIISLKVNEKAKNGMAHLDIVRSTQEMWLVLCPGTIVRNANLRIGGLIVEHGKNQPIHCWKRLSIR